ncbi:glyceraldehyde 3-phosphate reductase [Streptomyces badius]
MEYRRTGRSGLKLPALSLGLWHNFGDDRTLDSQRAILRRAFDLGVTHFDLANGPRPAARLRRAELRQALRPGFLPVPRRTGHFDQGRLSDAPRPVRRVGLPEVSAVLTRHAADGRGVRRRLSYSHRFDPGALASAVQQGKALYVGVSSYNAEHGAGGRAAEGDGRPGPDPPAVLLHDQPLDRGRRAARHPGGAGMGCISFVPLAQACSDSSKGIPEGSRATQGKSLDPGLLSDEVVRRSRPHHPGAAASRSPSSPSRGCCATRAAGAGAARGATGSPVHTSRATAASCPG